MPAEKKRTYNDMSDELNKIIAWFEGDEVNLEDAVAKYETAMSLLNDMEEYLKSAQNKIKKITLKFDSE